MQPLGLGHAVWCARDFIADEPFAILLADDLVMSETPCLKQLVDTHAETGGNVVAVMDVPRDQTDRYGILDLESDDGRLASVRGLVEKPSPDKAPSTLSIIGRYILMPGVFEHLNPDQRPQFACTAHSFLSCNNIPGLAERNRPNMMILSTSLFMNSIGGAFQDVDNLIPQCPRTRSDRNSNTEVEDSRFGAVDCREFLEL